MYDKNDILARLQNGESADDIATEMAEALNAALDQKREVDEAAARADEFQKQKKDAADHLADQINEFFNTYYGDIMADQTGIDGATLIEMSDGMVETLKSFKTFAETFFPEAKKTSGKADAPVGKKEHKLPVEFSLKKDPVAPSDDNIIGKFLKDFGLM